MGLESVNQIGLAFVFGLEPAMGKAAQAAALGCSSRMAQKMKNFVCICMLKYVFYN